MRTAAFVPIFIFSLASITLWGQAPRVIISSNANSSTHGLYVFSCDTLDGKLSLISKTADVTRSSYHNMHPAKPFLYSVGENEVRAFSIDPSGVLTMINKVSSMGNGPCYVSVDQTGKYAFVANYSGGSIASYTIREDGSLSEAINVIQHEGSSVNKDRQEAAHPHLITVSPDNEFVLVPDLGMDQIVVYRLDVRSGKMHKHSNASVAPGAGPRHLEFHPNGEYVYVLNELNSTVDAFSWKDGEMKLIETYQLLPGDFTEFNKSADIHLTSDGRFLYASNRGHDSLTGFKVLSDGRLEMINRYKTTGETPRNFFILPTDRHLYVANRQSDEVVLFSIDPSSGDLEPKATYDSLPGALCIKMIENR